jgi:hypothetical protein
MSPLPIPPLPQNQPHSGIFPKSNICEWRSSDGSLLTYTGFHPTEPNLGTAENCSIILIDYLNYQWADISCDALCPFACEIISF